jgi:hypothetical protein
MANERPLLSYQRRRAWQNKHQLVNARVERLYDVWNRWEDGSRPTSHAWRAGLSALRQIVIEAESLGRRVRGIGAGWSLSEAAAGDDFLLNTKPLNFVDVGIARPNCAPGFVGDPAHLVFAQCGVSVLQLNQLLESRGLALPTSGASNGQTIAGAVSTGTHGAANTVGAIQEFVVGLHVVGQGGRHYWLERKSRPVVSDAFVASLGAELRRDDALFDAAVVSFGSFGVIHAVMLEVVPLYVLERHVRSYHFDAVRQALTTLDVSSLGLPHGGELPYHFEVVVNPYQLNGAKQGAHVRALYKRSLPKPGSGAPRLVTSTLGDDLINVVGAITDGAEGTIRGAVDLVLGQQVKPVSGALGSPGQTFGATSARGGVLSMELGVAPGDVVAAVQAIAAVADAFPFAGLMAIRYVKASAALLAFTSSKIGSPTVATIEIPCAGAVRSHQAFDRIWAALEQRGIRHSFHWGQCLPPHFGVAKLQQLHGDHLDRWLASRRAFLSTPAARRCFSNGFVERLGLAD